MKHRVSRHSDRWRPRTELRATENTARNVLKLLRRIERGSWGPSIGGKMSDAVGLAEMIERMARFGQRASAEDAIDILARIETLVSSLRGEVDCIIALYSRQSWGH